MMRRPSRSSSQMPEADLSALKHGVESDWCRKCFASSASSERVRGPRFSASQRFLRGVRLTSPSAASSLLISRVRAISGRFTAPDARLNILDAGHDIGDGIDHVVRAALRHAPVGALAPGLLLRRCERPPLVEHHTHLVAAYGEPYGPHPGIQALLHARDGVVDLH